MTQELTTAAEARGIAPNMTREQVDLIKRTVCKDSTDSELKLFLYTAARTGLDPLARQIHAVKRAGTMTIQTGIDGYRLIADRTGKYAPGPITVAMSKDGAKVESATAVVKKLVGGEWVEVSATAYFEEYRVANSPMWTKMPRLMLSKCAEALALRRAFPAELSGVYTAEEMEQAGGGAATSGLKEPKPVDKTAEKPAERVVEAEVVKDAEAEAGSAQEPAEPEAKEPAPAEAPAEGARVITEKQGKRLYAIWKDAGKSDKEVRAYLKATYGYSTTRDIKDGAEYEAIVKWAQDTSTNAAQAA